MGKSHLLFKNNYKYKNLVYGVLLISIMVLFLLSSCVINSNFLFEWSLETLSTQSQGVI